MLDVTIFSNSVNNLFIEGKKEEAVHISFLNKNIVP